MNNMTLAQLKRTARDKMDSSYPGGIGAVLRGALLYLLLTNWVSLLVSLIQSNPLDALAVQMQDALSTGSPAALSGVLQSVPGLFQPPTGQGRPVPEHPGVPLHPGDGLRLLPATPWTCTGAGSRATVICSPGSTWAARSFSCPC